MVSRARTSNPPRSVASISPSSITNVSPKSCLRGAGGGMCMSMTQKRPAVCASNGDGIGIADKADVRQALSVSGYFIPRDHVDPSTA